MRDLIIYPNTKIVSSEYKGLFWCVLIGAVVLVAIAIWNSQQDPQNSDPSPSLSESPFLIATLLWGIIYFINEIIRMRRLSQHLTPLITLSPHGATDHFYIQRELKWSEINFVGCRTSIGRDSYDYFIIKPNRPNWQYYLRRLYSTPMKYKLERLSVANVDMSEASKPDNFITSGSLNKKYIGQYLRKHAPKAQIKRANPIWLRYLPYAIILAAFVIWISNRVELA